MSTKTRAEGNTLPIVIILGGLLFAGFVPANATNVPTQVSADSNIASMVSVGGGESEMIFSTSSALGILADH